MKALFLALGLCLFINFNALATTQNSESAMNLISDTQIATVASQAMVGHWYCKESPQRPDKYVRCNSQTGQCVPPDFDELFQCKRALPH